MDENEFLNNVLLTLLSSSETSSDEEEDLIDLLTLLDQELLQQKKGKVVGSNRRKRGRNRYKMLKTQKSDKDDDGCAFNFKCPYIKLITEPNNIKDGSLIDYVINWRQLDHKQFRLLFRFRMDTFQQLLQKLKTFQQSEQCKQGDYRQEEGSAILLAFLLYAGHNMSIKTLIQKLKMPLNIFELHIAFCLDFLQSLVASYIRFPQNEAEKQQVASEFYNIAGLKDVLGCVEKVNLRLSPNITQRLTSCRLGLSTQVACDARGRFMAQEVDILESKLAEVCGRRYCFLASLKYWLRTWTITPYQIHQEEPEQQIAQLHADQLLFNEKFMATYNVLPLAVSQLQRRFRQLYHIDTYRLSFARRILSACMVLHNFAIDSNDGWLDDAHKEEDRMSQLKPLIIDPMVGHEATSELDRFNCTRGIEKRERMMYESCISGSVDDNVENVIHEK